MFFRFAAALVLVVLVSMVGIGLEKQTLEMKRAVSRQYFQKDLLLELHAKLRLSIQQLTAPSQLTDLIQQNQNTSDMADDVWRMPRESVARSPESQALPQTSSRDSHSNSLPGRLPLLRWAHPAQSGK